MPDRDTITSTSPPPSGGAPVHPVLAWLQAEGARYRETRTFVEAMARRLLDCGIPLFRMTTGVPLLHPQIDSLSCLWTHGEPVSERRLRLDADGIRRLENSPMALVYSGEAVRGRLEDAALPGEYPIFTDLRAEGVTDYIALPLAFSDGTWKGVTYATRRPGGFGEDEVAFLTSLSPALAMVLEIHTLRRTARTLLDTYVGPTAGQRVLDGAIKRGMHERIEAVIWLCDLRGFTTLAEHLSGDELLSLLDDYFGAINDAVSSQGGEVLKFIGDAMLAIFTLADRDPAEVAVRALAAAGAAHRAIDAINAERKAAGRPAIRYGIALHVGDVLYGNIGGSDRLDFTVIGRAVNVAARIESLCKVLGRDLLVSGELAALCPEQLEALGRHTLKGVDGDVPVFGLPSS